MKPAGRRGGGDQSRGLSWQRRKNEKSQKEETGSLGQIHDEGTEEAEASAVSERRKWRNMTMMVDGSLLY